MKNIELKNEQRTRKHWLISSFIFWFMIALSCGLELCCNTDTKASEALLIAVISTVILFSIIYYFSYKKSGTILLLLHSVCSSLMYFSGILEGIEKGTSDILLGTVITLPFLVYYWVNSYRLYKINSKHNSKNNPDKKSFLNNNISGEYYD